MVKILLILKNNYGWFILAGFIIGMFFYARKHFKYLAKMAIIKIEHDYAGEKGVEKLSKAIKLFIVTLPMPFNIIFNLLPLDSICKLIVQGVFNDIKEALHFENESTINKAITEAEPKIINSVKEIAVNKVIEKTEDITKDVLSNVNLDQNQIDLINKNITNALNDSKSYLYADINYDTDFKNEQNLTARAGLHYNLN